MIAGSININPNNRPDYLFLLKCADGTTIDRNDLHKDFAGYTGDATSIRIQPKGNGNQNALTVDGTPYTINNGTTYVIESENMSVHLYNDKVKNGKALGKWYIIINAADATIDEP